MSVKSLILAVLMASVLTLHVPGMAEVPQIISYQGILTDSDGNVIDGTRLVKFKIYDSSTGDNTLWETDFQIIEFDDGLFTVLLGSPPMPSLPEDLSDYPSLYLGVTVDVDEEISPLTQFTSVPFALRTQDADYAAVAETAVRQRDLYHNILDINPGSITTVHFIAWRDAPGVTLYLYGSGFQGVLAAHTHDGNNPHSHDFTGSTNSASVNHNHSYSGSTATGGAAHSHSGTTGNYNLSHSHGGSTESTNIDHSHGGTTNTAYESGHHHHDFLFQGVNDGNYLVHTADYGGLTAHGTQNVNATGSVDPNRSEHMHGLAISNGGGSHSHNLTTQPWGGNHNHSFTTNSITASHAHSYSGTTGAHDIAHSHTFDGTVTVTGTGLGETGLEALTLPSDVSVYVDDVLTAGPFTGNFASGGLDLSSFVYGSGEHTMEVREAGGTGGRISYNLFVE